MLPGDEDCLLPFLFGAHCAVQGNVPVLSD